VHLAVVALAYGDDVQHSIANIEDHAVLSGRHALVVVALETLGGRTVLQAPVRDEMSTRTPLRLTPHDSQGSGRSAGSTARPQ
jgi:hypothetical protein